MPQAKRKTGERIYENLGYEICLFLLTNNFHFIPFLHKKICFSVDLLTDQLLRVQPGNTFLVSRNESALSETIYSSPHGCEDNINNISWVKLFCKCWSQTHPGLSREERSHFLVIPG